MRRIAFTCAVVRAMLIVAISLPVLGADPPSPNPPARKSTVRTMQLSDSVRQRALNRTGDCVQCSLVHCGHHCDVPEAATLLWDTKYGPAVLGGSTPTRVAGYCNQRHIEAYNVTGIENTKAFLKYASETGRFAAVGCWPAHFQTYYGRKVAADGTVTHLVCNNQTRDQIANVREYSDAEFWRLHMQSGAWCIVLKKPNSENPEFDEWWK